MSQVACPQCNGTGWLNCPDCKGRGVYRQGAALWTQRSVCTKCFGRGVLGKCEVCSGTGRIERPNDIQNLQSSQPELSVENYEFSEDQVRSRVEKGRAGNYVLGYSALHSDTNIRVFHPTFVGRSDSDLREALLTRLAKKKAWHDQFKFSYAATVKEAFEKECQEFHLAASAKALDNENHPEPPAGTNLRCPIPNCSALES